VTKVIQLKLKAIKVFQESKETKESSVIEAIPVQRVTKAEQGKEDPLG